MQAGLDAPGRATAQHLRAVLVAGAVIVVALVGIAIGIGLHAWLASPAPPTATISSRHGLDGEATWTAGARPAPAITTLRDQSGRLFSPASLRGHTVVTVFFDSQCHQQCPLTGRSLAAAERGLPAEQRPVLVVVSVNPRDTAASARRAARAWGLAQVGPWHWLMGTHAQLAPVWRAYHVSVAPGRGDIVHTEALYLIDRRGYERSAYLYPFALNRVAHDLRALARERRTSVGRA